LQRQLDIVELVKGYREEEASYRPKIYLRKASVLCAISY